MGLYLFGIFVSVLPLISLYFIMFYDTRFLFMVQCKFKPYRNHILVFEVICVTVGYQIQTPLLFPHELKTRSIYRQWPKVK